MSVGVVSVCVVSVDALSEGEPSDDELSVGELLSFWLVSVDVVSGGGAAEGVASGGSCTGVLLVVGSDGVEGELLVGFTVVAASLTVALEEWELREARSELFAGERTIFIGVGTIPWMVSLPVRASRTRSEPTRRRSRLSRAG